MPIPQRIAALPAYLPSYSKELFRDAAPGHKFLTYFRNWQGFDAQVFAPYKGKVRPLQGADKKAANKQLKTEYDAVLNEVCDYPASAKAQLAALGLRQQTLIENYAGHGLRITTTSTAPFATGLGNEHPIENGFAFLTPYGLPYLAGSGVKGIVRRAMQELCKEGADGFTNLAIDALLGIEDVIDKPEDARRGALDFWDVFPSPAGNRLVVEIMTPHFGKYYQGTETPHESGAPVPVFFLAIPAKSQFDFHVVCHPGRLPESLQNQWQSLLNRAFAHAFEWVGFGAKTSVGYGAMAVPAPVALAAVAKTAPAASAPSVSSQTWPIATLILNASTGDIKAVFENQTTALVKKAEAEKLLPALGEERKAKLKKKQELKNVSVEVSLDKGVFTLLKINPTP